MTVQFGQKECNFHQLTVNVAALCDHLGLSNVQAAANQQEADALVTAAGEALQQLVKDIASQAVLAMTRFAWVRNARVTAGADAAVVISQHGLTLRIDTPSTGIPVYHTAINPTKTVEVTWLNGRTRKFTAAKRLAANNAVLLSTAVSNAIAAAMEYYSVMHFKAAAASSTEAKAAMDQALETMADRFGPYLFTPTDAVAFWNGDLYIPYPLESAGDLVAPVYDQENEEDCIPEYVANALATSEATTWSSTFTGATGGAATLGAVASVPEVLTALKWTRIHLTPTQPSAELIGVLEDKPLMELLFTASNMLADMVFAAGMCSLADHQSITAMMAQGLQIAGNLDPDLRYAAGTAASNFTQVATALAKHWNADGYIDQANADVLHTALGMRADITLVPGYEVDSKQKLCYMLAATKAASMAAYAKEILAEAAKELVPEGNHQTGVDWDAGNVTGMNVAGEQVSERCVMLSPLGYKYTSSPNVATNLWSIWLTFKHTVYQPQSIPAPLSSNTKFLLNTIARPLFELATYALALTSGEVDQPKYFIGEDEVTFDAYQDSDSAEKSIAYGDLAAPLPALLVLGSLQGSYNVGSYLISPFL